MNFRFLGILAVASVAVVLPLVACSSDSSSSGSSFCTAKGNCEKDVEPDQASKDGCTKAMNDPKCGSLFKASADCTSANTICGVTGKSETKQGACTKQQDDYNACLASKGKDGG